MEEYRGEHTAGKTTNVNNKRAEARIELSKNFESPEVDGEIVANNADTEILNSLSPAELLVKKHRARQELLGETTTTKTNPKALQYSPPQVAKLARQALHRATHTAKQLVNERVRLDITPDKEQHTQQKKDENDKTTLQDKPHETNKPVLDAGLFRKYYSNKSASSQIKGRSKSKNLPSPLSPREKSITKAEDDIVSIADIVLAERKQHAGEQKTVLAKERRFKTAVLLSVVALFLGGLSIVGFFFWERFVKEAPAPPVMPVHESASIVRADNIEFLVIDSSKNGILAIRAMAENLVLGTKLVTNIVFVVNTEILESQINTEELLKQLNSQAPSQFVRSLDDHMLGLFAGDQTGVFLFLTTSSFSNAFAGMLSWEETTLNEFAFMLSGTEPSKDSELVWSDDSIQNIDVRVLRSSSFDNYLFYTFLNKETLLLATTEEAMREAVDRFQTPGKVLR